MSQRKLELRFRLIPVRKLTRVLLWLESEIFPQALAWDACSSTGSTVLKAVELYGLIQEGRSKSFGTGLQRYTHLQFQNEGHSLWSLLLLVP